MAFHTAAYFQAAAAGNANVALPALADGILPLSGNGFLPYKDYKCFMVYASGVSLTKARLNSGTIRQVNPSYIRPLNKALLPTSNPNLMWLRMSPFYVQKHEELDLEFSNNLAMGTENEYGLIWLEDTYESPPVGRYFKIRYTGATAVTAQAWSLEPYTLDTALPAGQYAVIDHECISTTGICARLVFDQQVERPGVLMQASAANRELALTANGTMGVFGRFFAYSLPRLELLCNAADSSFEGYITIVKLQGGQVP